MILNASRTPPDASGITPDADRSTPIAAKQRGEDFGHLKYAEEEELVLSQLPCWADLTPEQYRERIAELVTTLPREERMRKVTVTYTFRETGCVPMIRLRGKWLQLAGLRKAPPYR